MKKRTARILDVLEKAVDLIEKCGGPGSGRPGPCPKPKPAGSTAQKPPAKKPLAKKPPAKKPPAKKPPAKKPPHRPMPGPNTSVVRQFPEVGKLDKKPRAKYSSAQLAEAGMSVKNGQISISKPKTAKQATMQLEIMGAIYDKAMSMANVAMKLPEKHPERVGVYLLALGAARAHSRVVSNAKAFLQSMPQAKKTARILDVLEKAVDLIEKCGGPGGTPGPCPKPKPTGSTDSKPKKKDDGFLKFRNGAEAEKTLAGSASQWTDGPFDDYFANKGVKAYCGTSDSFRINDCLRNNCSDRGLKTKSEELAKVLSTTEFPESIRAFRSINPKTPEEREAILSSFREQVGSSFVDPAFVSTTANESYAKKWAGSSKSPPISVEVRVRKGAKAAYIPKEATGRQEWEVLIQKNSRFNVISVENDSVILEYADGE